MHLAVVPIPKTSQRETVLIFQVQQEERQVQKCHNEEGLQEIASRNEQIPKYDFAGIGYSDIFFVFGLEVQIGNRRADVVVETGVPIFE